MKKSLFVLILFISVQLQAQILSKNAQLKSFLVQNDTIKIDTVSISSANFNVFFNDKTAIDTSKYHIDFSKALLVFKPEFIENNTEVSVQYTSYPTFLTKNYYQFNKKLIVPNANNQSQLYSLTTNKQKSAFKPFEGLNADGNITRGVTIGNNQDAVVNSTLDLQIEGRLSDKVTLRASIVDTNLPIQDEGNTYKLNEFDRVFIELATEDWRVNAGDIYLNNNETEYLRFNKKITGLGVDANINVNDNELNALASAGFVQGKFNQIKFNGQEGNQGPYKIADFESNTYVLILSGTEEIYINGQLLKRGEENDYVIDYNTAEITFNTTFPITSNMRISAEYQYTDRVYNRFITYEKANYVSDKLTVNGYFYNENDLKNQSLEPELTDEQKQILANAGDEQLKMISPSAYEEVYSENKILYKKALVGSTEIFVYEPNENPDLYTVTFSYLGENSGSYAVKETIAFGKIYEYVGENLGDYAPVIKLTAPTKLQVAVISANYKPSKKTAIAVETAFSNNDQNLFSDLDDENDHGFATKLAWKQQILDKKWSLNSNLNFEYISENFETVQRIQNIEFDRDWNIVEIYGNQQLLNVAFNLSNKKNSSFNYEFSNLQLSDNYKGGKHLFYGNFKQKKLDINFNTSLLNNENPIDEGQFLRYFVSAKYNFKKSWLGANTNAESNKLTNNLTSEFITLSHKFNEYAAFTGVGDSTKVFVQIGANFRTTDSIQNNAFQQVSKSKTYYVKSTLIHSDNANLSIYANYRTVENTNFDNEESLNSRILYKQQLWNQFVSFSTRFETQSGTLPLQDYNYIETETGQGFYAWVDYNNNGVKELNEFEIAQFQDQANYLRVILPTINYLPTYRNIFNQTLVLNPQQWNSQAGVKNVLSHFYNQATFLIDNKTERENDALDLNPFDINNPNMLGLLLNFNNAFYFNKGKQDFSTTYRYLNTQNKSTTTIDVLDNQVQLHQLQFEHEIADFWLFNLEASQSKNEQKSANFTNRNYDITNNSYSPKLSYVYNKNASVGVFYKHQNKENLISDFETLKASIFGFEANYMNNEKSQIKATINLFNNDFTGENNSPVAYQMLEGLQPGKNYTWSLLFQRSLFSFLNLNINYLGRKSETSKTIHTGSVQLKALF